MKVLYIGQYSTGTTSFMRCETLRRLLKKEHFEVIDIHQPFFKSHKVWRTLGFRYKKGPLIKKVNDYVLNEVEQAHYDLIWVDKAVYLTPQTTQWLKTRTAILVHFTPDPAFTFHQSKHFFKSLPLYDVVITTKSYELEHYKKATRAKVLYATQGFDKALHQPSEEPFDQKKGLAFIGHYEEAREKVLKRLLALNIPITLAGINWKAFAEKHKTHAGLNYLGEGVYGQDYVKTLQKAKIAWGAISKWVPELHTTRTFEIPACGTALLTESNSETEQFFARDEAIFYKDTKELAERVSYYMEDAKALKTLTEKGTAAVYSKGFDYESILSNVLKQILS